MSWLSEFKKELRDFTRVRVPRADRWPVNGLRAFFGLHTPCTPAAIKNISSSGIYLAIQEPLPVGQLLKLKIQLEAKHELSDLLQLSLEALVARQDEFGAGLAFVPPPGLDPALWAVLVRGIAVLTEPDQVVEVFRTLRIVLFLCRLCPTGAEEAMLLLDGRLDSHRTETLLRIVHSVEARLAADPDAARLRIRPKLLESLLRNGSWAADDLAVRLWTGLFLSSCSATAPSEDNLLFVETLIHLTPFQAMIFQHACERALSTLPPAESPNASSADPSSDGEPTRGHAAADGLSNVPAANPAPAAVLLTAAEITRLTSVTDLARNASDVAYLFNLGLIAKVVDFTSYRDIETFDVSPSPLGLELYRHCQGQRKQIDPDLAWAARQHLDVFLPPPIPSAFANYAPLKPEDSPQE